MSEKMFFSGIVLVVVSAIVFGLYFVGGPGQARKDRFDDLRYRGLERLAKALNCKKIAAAGETLPEKLSLETAQQYCGVGFFMDTMFTDSENGQAFSYKRLGDRVFQICASFHDAKRTKERNFFQARRIAFDPETGCARVEVSARKAKRKLPPA